MDIKNLYLAVLLVLLMLCNIVKGISIDLIKSEQYCFKISANIGDSVRMSFSVSGKGENKCRTQFFNPQKIVLNDYSGKRHGFLSHKTELPGIYQVCFSRMDMNIKKVSINLRVIKDLEATPDKAKEEDVNALVSRLENIRQDLDRVSENLEMMRQNKIVHQNSKNVGKKSETRKMYSESVQDIKKYTLIKILIIIAVGILQI